MIHPALISKLAEHVPVNSGDKPDREKPQSKKPKKPVPALVELAHELGGTANGHTVSWKQDGEDVTFTWSSDNSQSFECRVLGGPPATITFTKRIGLDRRLAAVVARTRLSSDDSRFDHDVRVVTRDLAAARMLMLRPAHRRTVRAPLDRGLCRVVVDPKGVSAKGARKHMGGKEPTAALLLPLVAELIALKAAAFSNGHFTRPPRRDLPSMLSLVAVITTAVVGVACLAIAQINWPLINGGEMVPATLLIAALAIPLAWGVTTRLFGGHSAPERLVFGFCLSWLVALPVASMGLGMFLNAALDPSEATVRLETITHKYQWHDDKNNLHSRAVIAPEWNNRKDTRFGISNRIFGDLVVGESRLGIPTHPGAFGWQWNEPVTIHLSPAEPDD